ncbi:MAG: right-handed parallel beta-helix repeat-containing protein, partial [Planctomycetes bacterium]|nr:right-handed parallel beta-helix repeat-containing protein [Planctomycetota bacterium]
LMNCAFIANTARGSGGAMHNHNASMPTLINCTFTGNFARSRGGGVNIGTYYDYYERGIVSTLTNCTFIANATGSIGGGGGVYNDAPEAMLTNCIFWGNSDRNGTGQVAQISGDTPIVAHSCVQDADPDDGMVYPGPGNIDDPPAFVRYPDPGLDGLWDGLDDDFGDLHLRCGSPCIDTGTNDTQPALPETDHDGGPRIVDAIVDMGAHEGPTQALLIAGDPVGVPEGQTAEFTVTLACEPAGPVQVSVAYGLGDADIYVESGATLTFDPTDFWIPQTVVLAAADDDDLSEGIARFRISAPDTAFATVVAREIENDIESILFVDADAVGANDGSSWLDAFLELRQAMILAAAAPAAVDEIRVAQGVYTPAAPNADRAATFQLVTGVVVNGGYAGWGTPDPDERDPALFESVLSGDLNGDDGPDFANIEENSYHVVTGSGTDLTAILDGFTVTGGNADADEPSLHRSGGGMCNYTGAPTVANCTFLANSATETGGGLYNDDASRPTLTHCTFIDNRAFYGGGMGNEYHSGVQTLTDCTFIGNSADYAGGGLYHSGNISMSNCTFLDNSTDRRGGGMYNAASVASLTNCTFRGNTAEEGGGMYSDYYFYPYTISPTLTNCTFSENSASRRGGAVYIVYYYANDGNPTLIDCTFTGNSAGRDGGALYNEEGNVTLTGCSFSGNSTDGRGGGVYSFGGAIELTDCTLNGNTAEYGGGMCNEFGSGSVLTNCIFHGNSAERDGGGMSGPAILTNCTFSDNSAGRSGGGMQNRGDSTLTGCTFSENSAAWVGGGMYNDQGAPTLIDCTFDANVAGNSGGGIYSSPASTLSMDNCTFLDNSAALGGGLGGYQSTFTLANCVFSANTAAFEGGGMYQEWGTAILTNCGFTENTAGFAGGAVFGSFSTATLTYCTFSRNSAGYWGGAMLNDTSSPMLVNCRFIRNSTHASPGWDNGGGGIYNYSGSSPSLINCILSGNSSSYAGGGMYNDYSSSPTLTNCTFIANTAGQFGGGVYNDPDAVPAVTNCILWANMHQGETDQAAQIYGGSPDINYSFVQGWTGSLGGFGNIDGNPFFVNASGPDGITGTEDDDLRLLAQSPCIDAGDDTAVVPDIADLDGDGDTTERTPLDLGGNPRFMDYQHAEDTGVADPPDYPEVVDIGAYELGCWDDDGDGKVTICHRPPGNSGNARTISVNENAAEAHLEHGDSCGPCP